jgi:hypothetical protein
VRIDDDLRKKNRLLPEVLYVDARESVGDIYMPGTQVMSPIVDEEGNVCLSREGAIGAAETAHKRLPSAAEYDAIVESMIQQQQVAASSGEPASIAGLSNGRAEWTTTTYDYSGSGARGPVARLRSMSVLKGYGDVVVSSGMLQSPDGKWLCPSDIATPSIGWRGVRSGAPRFVEP